MTNSFYDLVRSLFSIRSFWPFISTNLKGHLEKEKKNAYITNHIFAYLSSNVITVFVFIADCLWFFIQISISLLDSFQPNFIWTSRSSNSLYILYYWGFDPLGTFQQFIWKLVIIVSFNESWFLLGRPSPFNLAELSWVYITNVSNWLMCCRMLWRHSIGRTEERLYYVRPSSHVTQVDYNLYFFTY